MNDALLMDLADCGSPETLIGAILRHNPDLPRKVPIEDIARSVGIIDFKVLEVDGFVGGLTANSEKTSGIILTQESLDARRKRFTIGHELGHFLIRSHQGTQTCRLADLQETRRDTQYRRQEAEANRFSAGLLMPKPMFTKDLEALGTADVSHVKELGQLYGTSMEATVNRYVDLTSDICAFVFSKDGVVRYARATKDFPKLAVGAKSPLPSASLTCRMSKIGEPSKWFEHLGGIWLEPEWGKPPPKISEQCIVQSNGFRVTLLYIDARDLEDSDEGEELENSWRVGFRNRR
jgi:Zn-dependent peptidase ImmA (M78 family)